MTKQKYEILSFCIAIKRYKISSFVKKQPKHHIAKQLNLSVNTYSNLYKRAIEAGFIVEQAKGFRVKKLSHIIRELFKETEIYFSNHGILKGDSLDYRTIKNELLAYLVKDNVISRQQRAIDKNELLDLFDAVHRMDTDIRTKQKWYALDAKTRKRVTREALKRGRKADGQNLGVVITSVRHLSGILGISIYKANKILNESGDVFKRKIVVKWIKGCTGFNFDMARALYPLATVIPCVQADKIKVCFGSVLSGVE